MVDALTYRPTPFQTKVLSIPEDCDVFLGGGRGGGKSWAMAWAILQHVATYGMQAKVLYVRREWAGIREFEATLHELVKAAYPDADYSIKARTWRLPNGATIELTQVTTILQSYGKLRGRSFTLICVDELGDYLSFEVLDTLRSNLRAPIGVATRMIAAANPNGALHAQLLKRFVRPLEPWKITRLEGVADRIVHAPSTSDDNPTIDREAYKRQLIQSSPNDPGRLAAWLDGDWEAGMSNLFFAGVFDEERNVVQEFETWPQGAKPFLSFDWGSARPAYCGLFARVRKPLLWEGTYYPPKSLILVDEVHTSQGEDLNAGNGSTVEEFSAKVISMWESWSIPGRPNGVADDSIFHRPGGHGTASIADQCKASGINFRRANKGLRRGGWEVMRSMFAQTGKGEAAGLYIADNAEYALATVPFLPRDPKRSDDILTTGPDHAADAIRYAILGGGTVGRKTIGSYYGNRKAQVFEVPGVTKEIRV